MLDQSRHFRRPATRRQLEVLAHLCDYIAHHQRPPTIRDLARILRVKPNAIVGHLRALHRRGLIQRTRNSSRGCIPVGTMPYNAVD
jgi:DNA-binding MarR family transcriptional regulator